MYDYYCMNIESRLVRCRSHAGISEKAITRYCHSCSAIAGIHDVVAMTANGWLTPYYNSTFVIHFQTDGDLRSHTQLYSSETTYVSDSLSTLGSDAAPLERD